MSASADNPCPMVGITSAADLEGLGVKLNDLGCTRTGSVCALVLSFILGVPEFMATVEVGGLDWRCRNHHFRDYQQPQVPEKSRIRLPYVNWATDPATGHEQP